MIDYLSGILEFIFIVFNIFLIKKDKKKTYFLCHEYSKVHIHHKCANNKSSFLPEPKRVSTQEVHEQSATPKAQELMFPPYGRRKGFKITENMDFGDGGAFPEIHKYQYAKSLL